MSNVPTPMPMRPNGANWTVSNAAQTTGQDATGRFVKGWEVTYTLDTGHTGTVFVAGEVPNEATVKAAIQQSANALKGVINLSNQS